MFADKGWPRDTGERTHLFFGFNYRMNEMVGAVARVQLGRLAEVVAARRSVARRLVAELGELAGLRLPAEVDQHSFWLFPMIVDPDVLGASNAGFGKALAAEGIPVTAGYLDRPVYLTPAMTERRTYGGSAFPLTCPPASREFTYQAGDCPVAEDLIGRTLLVLQCNERFTDQDVTDIITAVRKVHGHYAK
ncbi:DegT/DnrJ/EryC1/StrS family aminotransferase [Fodinicola feengrottensis]|uniref:DegT/DnrJ/EryC1/StrS family aminotransferase n=1 Tax=Fodinicola feengrottensis TaxID=435914 RepID=UPI0024431247|nr:DegT/DnrJ/EryC1/StrS family aminotransferase [Fodinicola feengrottensis]